MNSTELKGFVAVAVSAASVIAASAAADVVASIDAAAANLKK